MKDDPATPTVEEVSVKVDSEGVPPYATGHLRNGFYIQIRKMCYLGGISRM